MDARLAELLGGGEDLPKGGLSLLLDEVTALHEAGRVSGADGKFAAASLLLRSDDVAQVTLAHELALAACATEPRARPVAATAYDRLRMLRGQPQKFGTQFIVRDSGRSLWPVEPHTTDSERAKWDLPPLAELQRRACW